jgi:hypothetical protein
MSEEHKPKSESAVTEADQRMAVAKAKFSAAAVACLKGKLDAERQVADALRAVDEARSGLRALADAELAGAAAQKSTGPRPPVTRPRSPDGRRR